MVVVLFSSRIYFTVAMPGGVPRGRRGWPYRATRDGGAFGADYGLRPVVPLTGLGAFTLSIFGGIQVPSTIVFSGQ
jgi:hypothetical protein